MPKLRLTLRSLTRTAKGHPDDGPTCCGAYGEVSTASTDEAHLGWALGAGLEADVGYGWSVKAEYLHIDLGTEDYNFRGKVYNGDPFNTDGFESDLVFDVFRGGLNYRF